MARKQIIIIHLCLFYISLNCADKNIGSVAPSQVIVNTVAPNLKAEGESHKQLLNNTQENQFAELTSLFTNANNTTNITENVSTISTAPTASTTDLPMMEGGGKPIHKGISPVNLQTSTTASTDMIKEKEKKTEPSLQVNSDNGQQNSTEEMSTKVHPKSQPLSKSTNAENMTPKIYPRKGVTFEPEPVTIIDIPDLKQTSVKKILITPPIKINNFIKSSNDSNTEMNKSMDALSNKSANLGPETNATVEMNGSGSAKDVIANPPLKRKKPLMTTDTTTDGTEAAVMKDRKPSPQHDYVIPVVVTILTAPMIVVLGLYFYKKGHECWERRHYRRMDFLIDGIYND